MSDKNIELDYAYLTQSALRQVIHDVLFITAELGHAPGEHYFLIEFVTKAPGVQISDKLLADYPDRMTIVLQQGFRELRVEDDKFSVVLRFDGVHDQLVIPFEAITKFVDPKTEFALHFEVEIQPVEAQSDKDAAPVDTSTKSGDQTSDKDQQDSADVVRLDSFRKK
jgi:uncharacterized protein